MKKEDSRLSRATRINFFKGANKELNRKRELIKLTPQPRELRIGEHLANLQVEVAEEEAREDLQERNLQEVELREEVEKLKVEDPESLVMIRQRDLKKPKGRDSQRGRETTKRLLTTKIKIKGLLRERAGRQTQVAKAKVERSLTATEASPGVDLARRVELLQKTENSKAIMLMKGLTTPSNLALQAVEANQQKISRQTEEEVVPRQKKEELKVARAEARVLTRAVARKSSNQRTSERRLTSKKNEIVNK